MSKEKGKREKNIQDKRKGKLGKEMNICMSSIKKRREKRGYLSQSGDLSNTQNRFGVKKNCLGR